MQSIKDQNFDTPVFRPSNIGLEFWQLRFTGKQVRRGSHLASAYAKDVISPPFFIHDFRVFSIGRASGNPF